MISELAFIALLFVPVSALLLAIVPNIGIQQSNLRLIGSAWNFSYLLGFFSLLPLGLLAYSFATDDFSMVYVVAHSNSALPLFFKIAATWGGHEGSMLLWLSSLSLWTVGFAFFSRKIDPIIASRTLSILGLLCFAFAIFVIFFSNPFERLFPSAIEGRDLNPMLQDVGLIFHPPLLYLGYVGFAVNFALTLSTLLSGHFDSALARWMRVWVLLSWFFLTLGIMLGAWWAYYELGWGGWWFWDPVENASLMPWLLGLGLLHSLSVSEQRGIFNYWTILFSLLAFALSLLGTFIVRSGVLTSVHAFAMDDERGMALLMLFFLLTTCSLTLFALKVNIRQSAVSFSFFSKESLMLVMNILIAVAAASVFLGTFYPMLFSSMGWGSISVGAPYFNTIFLPLIILLLITMILANSAFWKKIHRTLLKRNVLLIFPALVMAYIMISFTVKDDESLHFQFMPFFFVSFAIWLIGVNLWGNLRLFGLKRWAMVVAHCGLGLTVIGATMSSYFGSEIGVRLAPEQSQMLNGYRFHYLGFRNEIGPNYTSEVAQFEITKMGKKITALYPERRYYDVRTMNMSEVGLYGSLMGDIYIVMGDKFGAGEFSFRLHYKPFIRWLWIGASLMALGALLAAFSLKRRKNE